MNASSFITLVTYMLRQHGIRFYKGLYVTFKLAPDLKKNTVYLSSYSPLNEGHFSILTNPKIVSEYDQEIPQSQTADNPVAPRGRAAQPSRDTRKTN